MDYKIIVSEEDRNNDHIVNALMKQGVTVEKVRRLLIGDYLVQVGTLTVPVQIKRLNSYEDFLNTLLDENLNVNGVNEFIKRLDRAKQNNTKVVLLIEDDSFYSKLFLEENNIKDKVLKLEALYPNLNIVAIDKNFTGQYIYSTLYLRLMEFCKKNESIVGNSNYKISILHI